MMTKKIWSQYETCNIEIRRICQKDSGLTHYSQPYFTANKFQKPFSNLLIHYQHVGTF